MEGRVRSDKPVDPGTHVEYLPVGEAVWYVGVVENVTKEAYTLKLTNDVSQSKPKGWSDIRVVPLRELEINGCTGRRAKHVLRTINVGEETQQFEIRREYANLEWSTTEKEDILLCIISMPAIFIVMTCQSVLRAWQYIYCVDAGLSDDQSCTAASETVATVKALFNQNFDFANICQYYVVYLFTRLCWKFIRSTVKEKEMVRNMKLTSFQGVHWWCSIGIVSLAFNYIWEEYKARYASPHSAQFEREESFYDKEDKTISLVFAPFTLLCIYNMMLICNSPVINASLKGANAKFLGTRLLVLFTQLQLKAFQQAQIQCMGPGVVEDADSDLVTTTSAPAHPSKIMEKVCPFLMDSVGLNTEGNVMLLHATLLTYEALMIVLFNIFSWCNVDYHTTFGEKTVSEAEYIRSLIHTLEDNEIAHIFDQIDADGSGHVDREEFVKMFRASKSPLLEKLLGSTAEE